MEALDTVNDARDLYRDAEAYDAQYAHYRDDLAFYRELALDQSGPVLELGAGTGRVTVELARVAPEVVALEPVDEMRTRAQARLERAGVASTVTLRADDAREMAPSPRFALVVAPFHMLMHLHALADQDAVLARARQALIPGGAFACDVFAPRFGPMGVLRREAALTSAAGRHQDLWLVQHHDPATQSVTSLYLLDETDEAGVVRRTRRRLHQRYFHRYELERALRGAGFATVRIFGDFDRRPIIADAPRYVALARP
ncbi:MAG: class I SAM-dependent methyltransferase [Trueperaceae bacterium]|nr:class I SAM-dependent methyltransferase [Trueperaceae bacterium]